MASAIAMETIGVICDTRCDRRRILKSCEVVSMEFAGGYRSSTVSAQGVGQLRRLQEGYEKTVMSPETTEI